MTKDHDLREQVAAIVDPLISACTWAGCSTCAKSFANADKIIALVRADAFERAAEVIKTEKWPKHHVEASQEDGDETLCWYNEAIDDAVRAIRALATKETTGE